MSQPLSNICILDLSRLLPGAYASQMLADFGADVIKVEEPGSGDYSRSMPPFGPNNMGMLFLAVNRNKRSMTLNLKQGRDLFLRLVRQADVVLESFRPGVMRRLGLGYEHLKEVNPGIIYCAISGYGQDGPYRLYAGHDLNYVGYAGMLHYNRGPDGKPALPMTQIGDLVGGGYLSVVGILTALLRRASTGEGTMIDTSMTEGALSLLPYTSSVYLNTEHSPLPGHSRLDGALPNYNIYETSDGKYLTLAALEPKFWQMFCLRIGHPELVSSALDTSPEQREETKLLLRSIFKSRTRDEWLADLADSDACVGPVYSIDEVMNDPHMQARGVTMTSGTEEGERFQTLTTFPRISSLETEQRYAPPTLGEHTYELLREFGCSEAEIAQFTEEHII